MIDGCFLVLTVFSWRLLVDEEVGETGDVGDIMDVLV